MNRQNILQKVWDHFVTQKFKRCLTPEGLCVYRNNGNRCAIGAIIPDDIYEPSMEGHGAFVMIQHHDRLRKHLEIAEGSQGFSDKNWLDELQHCHDKAANSEFMKVRFRNFALKSDLPLIEN